LAIDPYTHFKKIIFSLDDSGVKFVVVGGIALGFYGIIRATKDIDLMILSEDAEKAIEALKKLRCLLKREG
jgi:predicted nucleotidyltransferase